MLVTKPSQWLIFGNELPIPSLHFHEFLRNNLGQRVLFVKHVCCALKKLNPVKLSPVKLFEL